MILDEYISYSVLFPERTVIGWKFIVNGSSIRSYIRCIYIVSITKTRENTNSLLLLTLYPAVWVSSTGLRISVELSHHP